MVDPEEKRNINYLMRNKDYPKHIDKNKLGKIILDNIVTQQIEEEIESDYQDVFGLITPKPISEDYDLGSW